MMANFSNTLHRIWKFLTSLFPMAARNNNPPNAAANGTPPPNEQLPKELVDAMQAIFGKHPGYRTSTYDPIYD